MPRVKGKMSFSDAAYKVLKSEKKPLSPTEVVELAIRRRLIETESKRPGATMAARLWSDDRFVSVGAGKWTLKEEA